MDKLKTKIKSIIKTKRFIYLSVVAFVVLFSVAINAAFSSFTSDNTDEIINTIVSGISYHLAINSKSGSVVTVPSNEELVFDLNINSLEDFDSKYEVIYKLCSDKSCANFTDLNDNVIVKYSDKSSDTISGIISASGAKSIRLVVINNNSEAMHLKFSTNSGYAHNTLSLQNMITSSYEDNLLASNILFEHGGGINVIEAPENTFNNISTSLEKEFYKITDDFGTSYYYRGCKELLNNNILFGDNAWKIVRINGDGAIRLIYAGKCTGNICDLNNLDQSDISLNGLYNAEVNSSIFTGFMYNLVDPVTKAKQEELTSSDIKITLETWYQNNIIDKNYDSYVTGGVFCNDRSAEVVKTNTLDMTYSAELRINKDYKPRLKCIQSVDAFTIAISDAGNKKLTFPVGLINADEVVLAGLKYGEENTFNYLTYNTDFWTMTPHEFVGNSAKVMNITAAGKIASSSVDSEISLRPVINLKASTKITGTGSLVDPYIVK